MENSAKQTMARPKWLRGVLYVLSFYLGFMGCNILLFGVAGAIRANYNLNDQNIWALLIACLFLFIATVIGIIIGQVQRRFLHARSAKTSYLALGLLLVLSVLVTPWPTPYGG